MLVVRTISLDQIDQSHEFMPGMAKYYFDQAGERLQKDVDYILDPEGNPELFVSGYLILHSYFANKEWDECMRTTVWNLTMPPLENPFDAIREQLDILEKDFTKLKDLRKKVKKPDEKVVDGVAIALSTLDKKPESIDREKEVDEVVKVFTTPDKNSYDYKKALKKSADEIRDKINDPEADAWIRRNILRIRDIVHKQNLTGSVHVLTAIYGKLTREYGFVSSQCKHELMSKYDLVDAPSTIRCISEYPTWRDIFDNILADVEIDGYCKVFNKEPNKNAQTN